MEVLGGLLLSAIGQFLVECYGVQLRGGYPRFQSQYLRRIRVPMPQDISSSQADELRQAFLTRDEKQAALDVYKIDSAMGVDINARFHKAVQSYWDARASQKNWTLAKL